MLLPATTATTTASGGFPLVFPSAVGQSAAAGIYPAFVSPAVPTGGQNSTRQLDRLRAPTSAVIVVQQEDVRDIAGLLIGVHI